MFTKLLNPKTDTYRALKDIVLSDSFQWFYTENKDKFGFYSHVFLVETWNQTISKSNV